MMMPLEFKLRKGKAIFSDNIWSVTLGYFEKESFTCPGKHSPVCNTRESMDKNIGKNISKNLSSNCSKKFLDHAKQSAADALNNSKNSRSNW